MHTQQLHCMQCSYKQAQVLVSSLRPNNLLSNLMVVL